MMAQGHCPTLFEVNSRLENLRLNAAFLVGSPALAPSVEAPAAPDRAPILECPTEYSQKVVADPQPASSAKIEPLASIVAVEEPLSNRQSPLRCNRMIRIRKRKVKVHHRKKRKKLQAASWKKNKATRLKGYECAFRLSLMEKVTAARQFDADQYVDGYLSEMREEWVPQTFEGRRHPTWLVKELQEAKELDRRRRIDEELDLITKKPLVQAGETVEAFIERMRQRGVKIRS